MITKEHDFYLVGLEVRTNNNQEMAGSGIIPATWERLFKENVFARLTHTLGSEIYAVYSNYESDETGDYDYFLGYRVKDLGQVPGDLKIKKVLGGTYSKYVTKQGPVQKVVPEVWVHVWGELKGKRMFKTDFEIYGAKAQDPNNAVVDVFVGVNSEEDAKRKTLWVLGLTFILPALLTLIAIYYVLYNDIR